VNTEMNHQVSWKVRKSSVTISKGARIAQQRATGWATVRSSSNPGRENTLLLRFPRPTLRLDQWVKGDFLCGKAVGA
jgi:hypothetical protein